MFAKYLHSYQFQLVGGISAPEPELCKSALDEVTFIVTQDCSCGVRGVSMCVFNIDYDGE